MRKMDMEEEEEEEKVLEGEIELQLNEQKESLTVVDQALSSDPSNSQLVQVRDELLEGIKIAEDTLLQLKRSRSQAEEDPHHQQKNSLNNSTTSFINVGSKCRFSYSNQDDQRWYNGRIIQLDASTDTATVSFLNPTSLNMMICDFFLEKRCRFATACRFSHGVNVPISSLKKFVPPTLDHSLVGSTLWALSHTTNPPLWRQAQLLSWNPHLSTAHVTFLHDQTSANLALESITLSQYADITSEEEETDSTVSEDEEELSSQGLGFLHDTTLQRGIQTETAIFANWETHTRGIASKMMANMGYRQGMGLGASGQGMLNPIPVKVLPPKQSLDHALQSLQDQEVAKERGKKRSRGGKRKREKKLAEAARAAKQEEESRPDVFSLINSQLAKHGKALNNVSGKKQATRDSGEKKIDRRSLIAYDDEVKELRTRVEKLEEMVNRNRKDKVVYEAAMRKLNETRKTLAETEAAHASASNAIVSKEKQKRWLKF